MGTGGSEQSTDTRFLGRCLCRLIFLQGQRPNSRLHLELRLLCPKDEGPKGLQCFP